eukprot:m.299348 g.299348  ORF g.299348 m.299348 type:complete len:751 (+) comp14108_c0_seq1:1024-3276(+)
MIPLQCCAAGSADAPEHGRQRLLPPAAPSVCDCGTFALECCTPQQGLLPHSCTLVPHSDAKTLQPPHMGEAVEIDSCQWRLLPGGRLHVAQSIGPHRALALGDVLIAPDAEGYVHLAAGQRLRSIPRLGAQQHWAVQSASMLAWGLLLGVAAAILLAPQMSVSFPSTTGSISSASTSSSSTGSDGSLQEKGAVLDSPDSSTASAAAVHRELVPVDCRSAAALERCHTNVPLTGAERVAFYTSCLACYISPEPQHAEIIRLVEPLVARGEPFLALEPDGRRFYHFLVFAYCSTLLQGDALDHAVEVAAEARSRFPADPALVFNEGLLLLTQNNWPAARPRLRNAYIRELTSYPHDGYGWKDNCTAWEFFDWRASALYGNQARRDAISVLLEPPADAPPVFGTQPYPWGAERSLACRGKAKCNVYKLEFLEMEVITAALEDAWIEQPQGSRIYFLHESCYFHLLANAYVRAAPRPALPSEGPVVELDEVLFLHWNPFNYYHFTAEALPKLMALEKAGFFVAHPNLKLIVPPVNWIAELLTVVGFPPASIVIDTDASSFHAKVVHAVDFRYPGKSGISSVSRLSVAPSFLLKHTRTRLAPTLALNERTLLVYAPRLVRSAQRTAAREEDLRAVIQETVERSGKLQFHLHQFALGVYPSVEEQIHTFARARVVVGFHGGSMANLLWCAPGTVVVEFPLVPLQPTEFATMAAALDLEYWVVPEIGANQLSPYNVTDEGLSATRSTLEKILAALDH